MMQRLKHDRFGHRRHRQAKSHARIARAGADAFDAGRRIALETAVCKLPRASFTGCQSESLCCSTSSIACALIRRDDYHGSLDCGRMRPRCWTFTAPTAESAMLPGPWTSTTTAPARQVLLEGLARPPPSIWAQLPDGAPDEGYSCSRFPLSEPIQANRRPPLGASFRPWTPWRPQERAVRPRSLLRETSPWERKTDCR